MRKYNQYYFAFLDLLGFKETVKSRSCEEIAEIFDEAKKEYTIRKGVGEDKWVNVISPEDIHYYIMSDSICIFIKCDIKAALTVLTWLCLHLQIRLLSLQEPVFVRGSISSGALYADNNILFGPAMVEAYNRAEKLALYPRIIIPQPLIEAVDDIDEKHFLNISTFLEQDGFYSIKYIEYFFLQLSTDEAKERVISNINQILDNSLDKSVREKYLYVKYWIDVSLNSNRSGEV